MLIKKGIPASPGICIANAFLLDTEAYQIPEHRVEQKNIAHEINRFSEAVTEAIDSFNDIRRRLSPNLREKTDPIISAHIQMLQDKHLHQQVIKLIKENKYLPEYAVTLTFKKYAKALVSADDAFFANRVQDIYDIERRLLQKLLKTKSDELSDLKNEVVVVAHDLTPSQTILLDRSKVKGFATDAGGTTSHTAIIARSIGIPAVVGLNTITLDISGGDTIIIDGNSGVVIINPDSETIKKYSAKERNFVVYERQLLEESKKLPAETKDGYRINLYVNIDLPDEVPTAVKHGAAGIGLLRTEFFYPSIEKLPSEQEQLEVFKKIIRQMDDKEIVIRTLDLGADKLPIDGQSTEQNPYLGIRAIRFSLRHIDLFKTQLRAILRASEFGNISIMFPMISSLEEVIKAKAILKDVQNELRKEKILFNPDVKIGIMIEVPSAAVIADILIKEVDFFSIGTNDLIQYTLAVDRGNEGVASLYQPTNPAVLRLIKKVIDIGGENGKIVAMCGEMSGNVVYTILLLGLGLKVFSMAPIVVPEIKKVIRSVSMDEARQVAKHALEFTDAQTAANYLLDYTKQVIPQLF
ncbi:MAG: phosphoenolpyruvate--protein phosphotransferase [Planctomycetes bacterium]|nr:phosphoenolpyruvate--protein phosphotransferase [Planctomycetota bacterium]